MVARRTLGVGRAPQARCMPVLFPPKAALLRLLCVFGGGLSAAGVPHASAFFRRRRHFLFCSVSLRVDCAPQARRMQVLFAPKAALLRLLGFDGGTSSVFFHFVWYARYTVLDGERVRRESRTYYSRCGRLYLYHIKQVVTILRV